MKKKNGFTIVELLVVIALMLSILGIAIVSLVNVSSKKKDESWKEVAKQIETAATEYFTANEYLFEGFGDNTVEGTISVGKLVEEDYLDKVTDPRDGKAISKCAVVNVTKKDGKITSSFNETTTGAEENNTEENNSCDNQSLVLTSDLGRIEEIDNTDDPANDDDSTASRYNGALTSTCYKQDGNTISDPKDESNGYCYNRKFTLNPTVLNKDNKAQGVITNIKYCNGTSGSICNPQESGTDITSDSDYKNFDGLNPGDGNTEDNAVTVVDIYNNAGALTKLISNKYKIDRESPYIENISITKSEDYNDANPKITINGTDNDKSGIDYYELSGATAYGESIFDAEDPSGMPDTLELSDTTLYNGDTEIEDLSGEIAYITVTIYDRVGNKNKMNADPYTLYKECDKTNQESCNTYQSCDWGCVDRNSKGKCTGYGYRSTCTKTNYYYRDFYTDNACGAQPTCAPGNSPKTKKVSAKAYKFSNEEEHCDNTGAITFKHKGAVFAGSKSNMKPKGAYRKYKFKELECSCKYKGDQLLSVSANNITEKTHPNFSSYVFYETKSACKKASKNKVKQVCTLQITGNLNFHGVKWNQGSDNHFSGNGWYNNAYKDEKSVDAFSKEEKVCEWACSNKK